MNDTGYIQFGEGCGPFLTQTVQVRNGYADNWLALFEGKWRRVYIQVNRMYIIYQGSKITIKIEGV